MNRGFCGSDADRMEAPKSAIRIRAIGSDPRIIAVPSDLLGALRPVTPKIYGFQRLCQWVMRALIIANQ